MRSIIYIYLIDRLLKMALPTGTKLFISHRRLFKDDQPRFFFGITDNCSDGIVKVTGYTWTRDPTHGFQKKHDRRTKIVALSSGTLIIYEVSEEVDIDNLRIDQLDAHTVIATDGANFKMDLSERI